MGYKTCPYCGANLDPDEQCDCQKEKTALPPTKACRAKSHYEIAMCIL